MGWPDRVPDAETPIDWTRAADWRFEPLDDEVFPAVALARTAGERGRHRARRLQRRQRGRASTPSTTVGSRFPDIVSTVAHVLDRHDVPSKEHLTVDDVLAADSWARAEAAARTIPDAPTSPPQKDPHAMSALLYTLGVVAFVLAILVSIGLHEFGHLVPAKKFGCKVPQWFIGFGPTVWSKQIGETEYGVKAIPLGGYVKIVGMLPPGAEDLVEETTYDEDGEAVHKVRRSNTGIFTQLISDARAAEWEYVKQHDTDRLFYRLAVVEEGDRDGGRADGQHRHRVRPVRAALRDLRQPARRGRRAHRRRRARLRGPRRGAGRACTADDPPTPAKEAGLQAGDEILSFNGTPFSDWDSFQSQIRANADGDAVIEVDAATSS